MAQERVPGLEHDGASLTSAERAVVEEMARRMSAEDPGYADRLSRLGGHDTDALDPPSRWAALPVALIGALLAATVLFVVIVMDGAAADRASTAETRHLSK